MTRTYLSKPSIANPPIVWAQDLSRTFRTGTSDETIVDHASFEIPSGQMIAVLGRSGSGKSTLLNMLGLLLAPTSGELFIAGRQVDGMSRREAANFRLANVGFIFQAFHLVEHKTVRENVELPLTYLSIGRRERRLRTDEVIAQLGLSHRRDSYPATLSGGEKQRVAIARAIVTKPKLLLCDEPTGNLDSHRAAEVLEILRGLNGPEQATIIVTHDPVVASACDAVIQVDDGVVSGSMPGPRPNSEASRAGTKRRRFAPGHWLKIGSIEAFRASFSRLRRNLFTALGVSLGIASLVLTVGLSATVSSQLSDRFNEFLAQKITLTDQSVSDNDYESIVALDSSPGMSRVRALNGVDGAGLVLDVSSAKTVSMVLPDINAVSDGNSVLSRVQAPIMAASPQALSALGVALQHGRVFDEGHLKRHDQVALIGSGVLHRLGMQWVPGMTMYLDAAPVSIIGVIGDEDPSGSLFSSVLIPLGNAEADELGDDIQPKVVVRVDPGAASQVGQEAPVALNPAQPDLVSAEIPPEPSTLRQAVDNQQQTLMLSMSAVTLVIGGVGIMNTFLVAVMERRREIGLRMALGSSRVGIIAQFGVEATISALIGAVIGILLGINTLTIISAINHWIPVIDPLVIPVGLGAGLLVGFLAGLFPAIKAANTDPVLSLAQS
ncbi:ABC transporter ATP-binding protein/permease [Arthrobacter sp. ERGS1:01]|uniref:ABC transporter ATP-binding protein/permease n=1 Tax=Arthrobacter sp. ERGS1:01 TaxID=1704044 RepID=UPI000AEC085F|nr:ABC transporter ATP-binding protein/permease [Arthrobacter sp. ERGS1:01]